MLVIPAVDIKGGRCVRLLQGREDSETVFSDDPSGMAARWEAEGAELLHVVDLDGAFRKSPQNVDAIKRIIDRVHIPIQLGGGIRSMETIAVFFDLGVSRVILGTEAIRNPGLVEEACQAFPGKIIVGIDARNGMVAVEGWTRTTEQRAIEVAKDFEGYGLAGIIFTDIHKDGMQTGPNIEETKRLAESVSTPIIASGGVADIDDIKALAELEPLGVVGVITGRALYAGTLNLGQAIKVANG
ncbi:MAG: 1-(5-phosphoribosyl)-5-[(5-phosphoribosylamino)methylideneamino]imidazole-4-carboxamide isomerase [Deltaproteobacteria bacterium]|nr:1-(5-phosphoribosyl)-5-[(5-phosphoribosylamino)methylideneamino]imidazole-4-carboxamide isomerase [Deltaproteobacteria bacterium]MBW2073703.1 1-(5-phosphoribosyl)-5-[(5-phosphoribosylamino)methylideneamino]imidazole-4-carboxamide isomerase [Deltaproteobacteria bacterium]RLB83577.1 MAG: 1-(5-phosphoribosyl)-5-((5-phosphoribosylamino)methylideneamino)imidazole-4-carboxamide isomerase [Deltaproteobacteria bacterium]